MGMGHIYYMVWAFMAFDLHRKKHLLSDKCSLGPGKENLLALISVSRT